MLCRLCTEMIVDTIRQDPRAIAVHHKRNSTFFFHLFHNFFSLPPRSTRRVRYLCRTQDAKTTTRRDTWRSLFFFVFFVHQVATSKEFLFGKALHGNSCQDNRCKSSATMNETLQHFKAISRFLPTITSGLGKVKMAVRLLVRASPFFSITKSSVQVQSFLSPCRQACGL